MFTLKKFAFTLAEVLITLSILGIVAALGIPSVIQHYKKAITVTKLKIAYSYLSSVVQTTEAINRPANYWDWSLSNDAFLGKYIVPYLDGAEPINMSNDDIIKKKIKAIDGTICDFYNYRWGMYNKWYRLKNGMNIMVGKGEPGGSIWGVRFWVDLDGLDKGKNTIGVDLFPFALNVYANACCNSSNIRRNIRSDFYPGIQDYFHSTGTTAACTLTLENSLSSSTPGGCNKSSTHPKGAWCSYAIYKNGWKIPKDYPVKSF